MPKCRELWPTNSFKLDLHFYTLYVSSAFHFIARLRRRRSTNGTQPHFVKRSTVGRCNNVPQNVGVVPPEKNWGPKNIYLFGFSMTSTLNCEYLLNQTWHRQSDKGVGKCEGSPTLPQNFKNFGPQTAQNRTGSFTHPHYFVLLLSIAHPLCSINVAPHSDSIDEMALGSSAAKIWSPKRC